MLLVKLWLGDDKVMLEVFYVYRCVSFETFYVCSKGIKPSVMHVLYVGFLYKRDHPL